MLQMKRRGNIPLKLVADMCVKAGFDHLLTVDLHSKESQGFFSCRMDNLRAAPFFLQYVTENIPDYQNAVIVARNPISARRATSFADRLKVNIAVLHGEHKDLADEREWQQDVAPEARARGRQDPLHSTKPVGAGAFLALREKLVRIACLFSRK